MKLYMYIHKYKHIHKMKWPGQGQQLNPIVNLWQDVKIVVYNKYNQV